MVCVCERDMRSAFDVRSVCNMQGVFVIGGVYDMWSVVCDI